MGEILIGTSGFSFDDWIGGVYPSRTKKQDMLLYYVNTLGFKTLEVNYTCHSMPSRKTMESFARRTSKAARNALTMIELLKEKPVFTPAVQAAPHN